MKESLFPSYRCLSQVFQQYHLKIGKYCRNAVSKGINEMPIPHYDWLRLLKVLSISRVCLSQACIYLSSNQPQPLQENRRRPRSDWHNDQKPCHWPWMRYQFHHRLTVRNCVVII